MNKNNTEAPYSILSETVCVSGDGTDASPYKVCCLPRYTLHIIDKEKTQAYIEESRSKLLSLIEKRPLNN